MKINKIYINDIINELQRNQVDTIIRHGVSFPITYVLTLADHYDAIFDGYRINYNKRKVVGYIDKHKITLLKF